ncbi:MAG: RNase adapter RapZ [Prevotellaceae bacterium]|nr:RNase adapter RapZ [Candidatus Faecinaster equi]
MKVVIITGMSGAGRSRAANWFEDQGYYCVDNMPPVLIKNFLEMASTDPKGIEKVAFVTDLRGGFFFSELSDVIEELRKQADVELTVLFLEAAASELVRRYNEVRRNHPLTGGKASRNVIAQEREMLSDIREKADFIIDTTKLKVSQLNIELDKVILGGSHASKFSVNFSSFGFKYGIPSEADMIVDVRFLPNPYYVPSLKKLTGRNKKIKDYVFRSELADQFITMEHEFILSVVPGFINEGKYHLNIAFGCTGGHHRSVAIAEAMAEVMSREDFRVTVEHRDLDLQAKGK